MNGKNTERWIYTRSGTGWSLGLGGGGFRGRDSGIGTGIGITMPLGSRSPVSCNVLFEDGRSSAGKPSMAFKRRSPPCISHLPGPAFSLFAGGLDDGFHQTVDIVCFRCN